MLTFLTGNKGKFDEAQKIIPGLIQKNVNLPEIQSLDLHDIISSKLEWAKKNTEGSIIVEDSSLNIDCLNGLPGPLIKWFYKALGNIGIYNIVSKFDNQNAQASVVVGLLEDNGKISYFEGIINGKIVAPLGNNGFGWDQIFQPIDCEKTFAEMDQNEKNIVSMRKIALVKLKSYLSRL